MLKDHKAPGKDGLWKTRPVVSASDSYNCGLVEILSDIYSITGSPGKFRNTPWLQDS